MIYIDILILAMIALFILNRLRGVLGKKTGNETDMANLRAKREKVFSETKPDREIKEKVKKKDAQISYLKNTKFDDQLKNSHLSWSFWNCYQQLYYYRED